MPTKLSVFCDKVIEAGWLTAIIVVPLFFNVYSSRVFEPDKLTLLRSIASVMAVTWVIKVVDKGLGREAGPESQAHNGDKESNAADKGETTPTLWERVSRTPLVLPTLALVAVYILSTLFSITSRVSLWGSYQRLQGTYTTFSYIVIFFLALEGLRRREQLDRLVTVVVLVSLPISLYGLMQHNQLDPLPWGGDVTRRVASNMGNSIFVSAYLIMAVPLTLARLVSSSLNVFEGKSLWDKAIFLVVFAIFVGAQFYAAILYVWGGLLVVLIFFIPLFGFSIYLEKPFSQFVPIGCYSGILATQLICIFFSGSRGPMLGLLGGLYFFALLFAVWNRSKRWAFVVIGVAVVGALFLVTLNLPRSPLAPFRELPYIGSLGRILETESGTGLVRVLIWEGVVKLVPPHEPLEFPSGEPDRWNFLRPFLGYGPESMYVAYNRFYPPDLAHVEARNASPDRSHNETFDALVITGLVGFVVYMILFTSLFYYGLKWLGLITNPRERNVFLCLWLGFGFLVMVGFWRVLGANFVGVALPFGMVIGLGTYLAIYTFFFYKGETREEAPYPILLIALLSALVAHFIEIHFGIAIAATRTYFWAYAALMVVIGYYLRRETVPVPSKVAVPAELPKGQPRTKRRRKRRAVPTPRPQPTVEAPPEPVISTMLYALLMGIVMVTMVFDYRTAQVPIATKSYSVLWLFSITWLFSGIIITLELPKAKTSQRDVVDWALAFVLYFAVSLGCFFAFHFIHIGQLSAPVNAASIAEVMKQADRVANTITIYYLFLFFLMLALATALMRGAALPPRTCNWWPYPILIVPILILVLIGIILTTNLNVIRADIYYKQGQAYDNPQSRGAAIELYKKALTLARNEDFYYLFLGRAYLEQAQATDDPAQRAAFLDHGLNVLLQARLINPLNTDHSANLARYYRTRGNMASGPADKEKYFSQALEHYRQATSLSPHNAQLFNEWGLVYLMMGDYERTMEKYQQSLALDQEFEQTYLQLGDLYVTRKELDQAAEAYSKAIELNPNQLQAHSSLSYIYSQQGKLAQAVAENLKVLELQPNDYASHKNLAILYQQLERTDEAIAEAEAALSLAPENDRASLESYIAQLKGQQLSSSNQELIQTYLSQGQELMQKGDLDRAAEVYSQALALDPNIVEAHSALGYVYAQRGRFPEAVEENLAVLRLAPNDYASHKNLSILYQQLGRIDEALAEAQIALGLAPENEKAALKAFIAQLQQASP